MKEPRKDKFDYIRRIFIDIFHNQRSKFCILKTKVLWRSSLKARLDLINITRNFGNFNKLHIRKRDFKRFIS